MPVINFKVDRSKPKRHGKTLRIIVVIGVVTGLITLRATLASNINLNNGVSVEFGHGVSTVTSCDPNVTVTPISTFVNAGINSNFYFTSVTVSDISNACFGALFTFKAYKNGQSNPLDLYQTGFEGFPQTMYSAIKIKDLAGQFTLKDAGLLSDDVTSTGSDNFTVSFVTAGPPPSHSVALAKDVNRISLETSNIVYEIGDEGPDGGVIIYRAGQSKNWGRYIEVAPENWNGEGGDVVSTSWCSNSSLDVNSQTTGIGFAKVNTDRMISPNCESGIGVLSRSYHGGGKTDWSVPTQAEMQLISTNYYLIPGLNYEGPSGTNGYWTSNGGTGGGAWVANVFVVGGGVGGVNKIVVTPYLRPIRYF